MSSWAERRRRIDALLPEVALILSAATHTPNELIHLALLEAAQLELDGQEIPNELHQLQDDVISAEDFHSLATLSTSGPFARVELVQAHQELVKGNTPGRLLVLKTLDRRWAFRMRQQQFPRHELAILRMALRSRSASIRVPQLLASFLSPTAFHLVLSHAPGGDLWSLLEQANADHGQEGVPIGLKENWVRFWAAELTETVEWLHAEGWAHRDIKPHNLLLTAQGHLLLTDFGSAAPLANPASATTGLSAAPSSIAHKYARALNGTPDYIAPEILHNAERVVQDFDFDDDAEERDPSREAELRDGEERAYGCEVDWWSLGVTVYELLYGQAPFFAESIAETYDRIVNHATHLSIPLWPPTSSAGRDFVYSLLVDAPGRPSSEKLKSHRWFSGVLWGRLDTLSPPYRPAAFELPPSASTSDPSWGPAAPQNASLNFNFESAFFSSPALSVLRPSPRSTEQAQTEETEYWTAGVDGDCGGPEEMGVTFMPPADALDLVEDSPEPSRRQPPSTTARPAFETPARPSSCVATSTPIGGGPTSSGRARRNVTDVEAWKEMQERAWEVGMTARKKQKVQPGSAGRDEEPRQMFPEAQAPCAEHKEGLEQLEQRRKGVLSELDGLEEKYSKLFALAKGA